LEPSTGVGLWNWIKVLQLDRAAGEDLLADKENNIGHCHAVTLSHSGRNPSHTELPGKEDRVKW
jgi:hypothetical protein